MNFSVWSLSLVAAAVAARKAGWKGQLEKVELNLSRLADTIEYLTPEEYEVFETYFPIILKEKLKKEFEGVTFGDHFDVILRVDKGDMRFGAYGNKDRDASIVHRINTREVAGESEPISLDEEQKLVEHDFDVGIKRLETQISELKESSRVRRDAGDESNPSSGGLGGVLQAFIGLKEAVDSMSHDEFAKLASLLKIEIGVDGEDAENSVSFVPSGHGATRKTREADSGSEGLDLQLKRKLVKRALEQEAARIRTAIANDPSDQQGKEEIKTPESQDDKDKKTKDGKKGGDSTPAADFSSSVLRACSVISLAFSVLLL